jgi:uncharacterized protein YecT (DUF1311 family)
VVNVPYDGSIVEGEVMSRIASAIAGIAVAMALAGVARALTVTHRVFAEKTRLTDISLAYPETGVKAIDDDIKSIIAKKAKQFRGLAQGDYLKGQSAYTDDADYHIARNDAQVFAIIWQEEADFHGAHPSNEIFTANYLLPDGWRMYLPEIVDGAGGFRRISALSIASLDKQLSGPDSMSDRDWIAKGAAPDAINFENFALLRDRLHIEFPSYQVAAYAAGPQTVDIPLTQLAAVMRHDWRAPQASFACAGVSAPLEIAICSDAHLARLDRQVAETYFEHIGWSKDGSIGAKVAALKAEQRAWLKARDQACGRRQGPAEVSCLMTLYRGRLDVLESMTE